MKIRCLSVAVLALSVQASWAAPRPEIVITHDVGPRIATRGAYNPNYVGVSPSTMVTGTAVGSVVDDALMAGTRAPMAGVSPDAVAKNLLPGQSPALAAGAVSSLPVLAAGAGSGIGQTVTSALNAGLAPLGSLGSLLGGAARP